jgi:hypothetical protein
MLTHGNIGEMSPRELREYSRALNAENKLHTGRMMPLPAYQFAAQAAASTRPLIEIWRSRDFLCQIFKEDERLERLSICRAAIDLAKGRWRDGIKWEELQQIKSEVGRGDFDAVEVFPKDADVVDVANMRHLWVFKEVPLWFAWRKKA